MNLESGSISEPDLNDIFDTEYLCPVSDNGAGDFHDA